MAQEGALRVPSLLLNCWLLANSGGKTVISFSAVTLDEPTKLHQVPIAWSYRGSWLKSVGNKTKQKDEREKGAKQEEFGRDGRERRQEREVSVTRLYIFIYETQKPWWRHLALSCLLNLFIPHRIHPYLLFSLLIWLFQWTYQG